MLAYIAKRFLLMIPTFIGITLVTFFMIQLAPGNPVSLKLQQLDGIRSESVSREVIEQTKKLYGLDKPFYVQYALWVKRLVSLDLGDSFKDHRPVVEKLKEALPSTLLLNGISLLLIYLISVPLGLYAALHPHTWKDRGIAIGLFVLYSLPSFWVAMMMLIFLAGGDYLNLFPLFGLTSDYFNELTWGQKAIDLLWHLVLPVTVLTYGGLAFLSRFSKAQVVDILRQDYVRTARAKGLSERIIMTRHVFRNALVPMVTLMGSLLPAMIGGSVIVEQIFSIPGMGKLSFEAVLSRDYPTVMAIAAFDAVLTLVGLFLSDLLYVMVDPRITYEAVE